MWRQIQNFIVSSFFLICLLIRLKLGSQRGNELNAPPSSPVKNLAGTIEGSFPNLHHPRWLQMIIAQVHAQPHELSFMSEKM